MKNLNQKRSFWKLLTKFYRHKNEFLFWGNKKSLTFYLKKHFFKKITSSDFKECLAGQFIELKTCSHGKYLKIKLRVRGEE